MKKKIIFIIIIITLLIISYIYIGKNIDNQNSALLQKIKLMIPNEIRQTLKEKVFVYSYIGVLERNIEKREKNLIDLSYKFTSTHGMYFDKMFDKK